MPLLLGTKRTHAQTSSDAEDENDCSRSVQTLASSSSLPTPATTRHASSNFTPPDGTGRKRKMPRYSVPSESPTNIFRVGNEMYYKSIRKGPKTLPSAVDTLLELRFQLKGFKVYRVAQVPSTYTFAHINQLILFLFGWTASHETPEKHQWRAVKQVVQHSGRKPREGRAGEIKASRDWVDLLPEGRLEEEKSDSLNTRRIEDEREWTVGQVWGAGGVFNERAVIYNRNDTWSHVVDITLCQPTKGDRTTDLPWLVRGKGAPRQDVPTRDKERPEGKRFRMLSFDGPAFERYLNDEVTTFLGAKELLVVTHSQAAKLIRARARVVKSYESPDLSDDDEEEDEDEDEDEDLVAEDRIPRQQPLEEAASSEWSD